MESTVAQRELLIEALRQVELDGESYNAWVLENLDMLVSYHIDYFIGVLPILKATDI